MKSNECSVKVTQTQVTKYNDEGNKIETTKVREVEISKEGEGSLPIWVSENIEGDAVNAPSEETEVFPSGDIPDVPSE